MEELQSDRQIYVQQVIGLYCRTPGTPSRANRGDRDLAAQLHQRRVPLSAIKAALLLATARRTLRAPDAPRLQPVRSFYYFQPVIDEVLDTPLDPGYVQYLRNKLRKHGILPEGREETKP